MRLKHTFHVFVDNFPVIYKVLLYRLIIMIIAGVLYSLCITPLITSLTGSEAFTNLTAGISNFFLDFISGEFSELASISKGVTDAFEDLMTLFANESGSIALTVVLIVIVYVVQKWFSGLGNYAAEAVINDKMALRANSPFLATLIKNLKTAAVYNSIYVPLSVIYDLIICVGMYFFMYFLVVHSVLPFFVAVFLFTLVFVIAIAVKMTFTTDWLPAIIRGRMTQKQAFRYTFSRKGKDTVNVLSNFCVLILIIFSVNVLATVSTVGVAALLTVPASYVIILCFELTNYFDREQIKYSIGNNVIVYPEKERTLTREEFFRGESD